MKSQMVHVTVALVAAVVGASATLWMARANGQPAPTGTPFTMPASMPGVTEPAAIAAQRAALTKSGGGEKAPIFSKVIDVSKLTARDTGAGTRRDLFDGPTVTLTNMEGHISTLRPGEMSHPPHQHVNEEAIFLTEGTLEVFIGGKTTVAHKGDVLYFSSMDWHNVRNVGTDVATYYVFNWSAPLKPNP